MEDGLLVSSALDHARRMYGSLTQPDFSFAGNAYRSQPHKGLVERLSRFLEVEDDTHLDVDVSFYYKLSSKSGRWHLLLSMVGPYAMLFRVPRTHWWTSARGIEPIVDGFVGDERRIVDLVDERGFTLVSGEQSKIPVEFETWSGIPLQEGPLFRVLFRDDSDLAW
ncbi:hypothetical protein AB0I39_27870 [Kitasatospora purpeofusca]|uniref:hypothetical protein n=1 Tax=Kitasatospora purpeofusca TaxID=67352 RepID=UPI0033FDBC44